MHRTDIYLFGEAMYDEIDHLNSLIEWFKMDPPVDINVIDST